MKLKGLKAVVAEGCGMLVGGRAAIHLCGHAGLHSVSEAAPELAALPQCDVAPERVLKAEGHPQVVRVQENVR